MSNIEELGLRLSASGVVETTTGVNMAGKAIGDLGKKADETAAPLARVGNTAKQTTAAMRQLPMQITDIVTSLASGMPVYMVAIQQGGQLKDSFGGIVPALRAVTSAISPMALGLLGVGAAGAAALVAFNNGQKEALGYRQAIVMTGNAAGVTTGQVSDMARGVSRTVGTQNEAAAAMTALIETSQVGGRNLMQFGEVAVRMERVTGQAVGKTAEMFADLAKRPLEASIALNDKINHLTLSVYNQIKALVEQKKFTEAAELAQKTAADALQSRTKELEGNLGTLEKAWKAVGGAAKWTWDQMLGIGREASLTEQIQKAEAELTALGNKRVAAARQQQKDTQNIYQQMFPNRKISDGATVDDEKAALIEKIATLREASRMQDSYAQKQAASSAVVRAAIAADQNKNKVQDEGKSIYDRLNQSMQKNLELDREELTLGRQLTDSERNYNNDMREITSSAEKLGQVRVRNLKVTAEEARASREAVEELRQNLAAQKEHEEKTRAAAMKDAQVIDGRYQAMVKETEEIGLNAQALMFLRMARLDEEASLKRTLLARMEGLPMYEKESAALQKQIEQLEAMRNLQVSRFYKQAAVDEKEDNDKRKKELEKSIEDGIMQGFRSGRNFSEVFLSELKAQFLRTVLKVPVRLMAESGADLFTRGAGFLAKLFGPQVAVPDANGLTGIPGLDFGSMFTGKKAWGGGVEPNGTYLVGENGPEVLRMGRQRGQVVSNRETPRSLGGQGGGGGNVIQFAPNISIDSRTDKAEIMGLVGRAMRSAQADLLDKMNRRMA
jgi:hypothetical protein